MTSTRFDLDDALSRWGGLLVGVSAFLIVVAIVTFLLSGAADDAAGNAEALRNGSGLLVFSAYLSVPTDLALLAGAVLLAGRKADTGAALLRRVAWGLVALATLLVVQFDLIMPRGFIPLAENAGQAPAVFEALYRTSNFVHSVGLFLTFACFLALFAQQARDAQGRIVPRGIALAGVVAWSLGLVVSVTLILERPLVPLAPAILVGWLLVSFMGLRTARLRAASVPAAREPSHVNP